MTDSQVVGSRSARRKSGRRIWRTLVLVLGALVTAGVLYVSYAASVVVEEIAAPPLPPEVPPAVRPAPVKVGERINILALGLDDDRLRSDTMMLLSVDPEARKVGVLQIPRDTRTLIAGKGTIEKINAAYASGVGDKQFPPNLRALKTVEDLLDIRIHYTVVVDLTGFRRVVDELGGVQINVPHKMDYDDPEQNLHIHLMPGVQKLSGKQALEFVRWRRNNDGTGYPDGDLGRIRTQQAFLRAFMDEALKPANLPFLPNQGVNAARYVETTLEPGRILSLAKLVAQIRKEDVEFATLPGIDAYLLDPYEQRQLSFYVPDPQRTREVVDRLVRGTDSTAASQAP